MVVTWVVRRHLLRGDRLPDRVQPHLQAVAESVGLVVVGKIPARLIQDVLRQPGAVRVGFCALAGDADRGRVLDCGGHGLVNQAEPGDHGFGLAGDERIKTMLGSLLDDVVLHWTGRLEVVVGDLVGSTPQFDLRDDLRRWRADECPSPAWNGLDLRGRAPPLSGKARDQLEPRAAVGAPLRVTGKLSRVPREARGVGVARVPRGDRRCPGDDRYRPRDRGRPRRLPRSRSRPAN